MAAAQSLRRSEQCLRWFFVVWLTVSTIVNIIDKNTLAILGPTLMEEFGMTNQHFANIATAFMLTYALMYTVGGRLVDRLGEKLSLGAFVLWWSVSCMLQAVARGAVSLGIFRFMLGLGEPGNYPAALRATAHWFRKDERGLPISIWSVGSSVGGLVAPPIIAFITLYFGWRMAFVIPGAFGLLWVLVWAIAYRLPARPLETESAASGMPTGREKVQKPESLFELLKDGRVRAIVLARMVSDGVWHFYITWLPLYLAQAWGYNLKDIGLFAWIPFLFGAAGGIFGGSFSDGMIRRGVAPAVARKRVLFTAGLVAPLGITVGFAQNSAVALGLIAVVAFVVYIWFITTAALVTDVFPSRVVASVLGLMGTAGSLGGIVMIQLAGYIRDHYDTWTPIFIIAGSGHLLATLILFFFMREKRPVADASLGSVTS
jgi:ACS family hexuronate transporter-like MFS transporter